MELSAYNVTHVLMKSDSIVTVTLGQFPLMPCFLVKCFLANALLRDLPAAQEVLKLNQQQLVLAATGTTSIDSTSPPS